MPETNIGSKKPVIGTSTYEQTLGRLLSTYVDRWPDGDAEQDLLGDTFMATWKHEPVLLDSVPPDRAVNQALLSWALDKGMKDKTNCSGNIAASLFASSVMWTSLTTDKALREALERQKEAEENMKEASRIEKSMIDNISSLSSETIDNALNRIKELKDQAEELAKQGVEQVEKVKDHPVRSRAISSAVDKAQDGAETVKELMSGWGIDPGSVQPYDARQVLELARSEKWKRIADYLGRAKERSLHTINAVRQAKAGSVSEVGRTKSVDKLFTGESMAISPFSPLPLRYKKLRTLQSSGLMGWIPKENLTKSGSFVMAVDESGSMGPFGCQLAKAIALGVSMSMREIVDKERRYVLFGFSNDVCDIVTSEDDWRKHVSWAGTFQNGGTDFNTALEYAITQVERLIADGVDTADIVMTSDGDAYVVDSTLDRLTTLKVKHGVRLAYIHIGENRTINTELRDYANTVVVVPRLQKDFEELIDKISVVVADRD